MNYFYVAFTLLFCPFWSLTAVFTLNWSLINLWLKLKTYYSNRRFLFSRSPLFFYTTGVILGVIATFVFLTLVLRNFVPTVCNASVTNFIMIMIHMFPPTDQTCWMTLSSMSLSLSMLALSLPMRLKIKRGGDSLLDTNILRHVNHRKDDKKKKQGCAINYRMIGSSQFWGRSEGQAHSLSLCSSPPSEGCSWCCWALALVCPTWGSRGC